MAAQLAPVTPILQKAGDFMFCPYCGNNNPDDASFCLLCGAAIPDSDPPVRARRSRPVWPWVTLLTAALVAIAVLLFLLLDQSRSRQEAPAPTPIPAATAAPLPVEPTPSPQPESVLITPAPATPAPPTEAPQTPTPAPATAPPATEAPSAGAVKLDADLQYRINIFLSNFSEQGVLSFNSSNAADDFLIRFVRLYYKINHHDLITYENGEECLSLDTANLYLNRFFGRTIEPVNGQEFMIDAWHSFRFENGAFRFEAADGESHNGFTVVYGMTKNADGTYTVQFQNYELDLDEYWDKGMENSLYQLDNDGVADLVWAGRATPVQGGTAVVRDYSFNGRATFQILSYEVWYIEFARP